MPDILMGDLPREAWAGRNVWAPAVSVGGNEVRQLMVPAGPLRLSQTSAGLEVWNHFGRWSAYRANEVAPVEGLSLRVPSASEDGWVPRGSIWQVPGQGHSPVEVLSSFVGQLTYQQGSIDGDVGLRRPQLGALHAVLGYWTTGRDEAATVVMPTGTGKTETMLALMIAASIPKLLVLVPSDSLRQQISRKFERLGVLQELGIVGNEALRPVVGVLEHGFESAEQAYTFAESCNVVVATPQLISQASDEVRNALLSGFTHLFVDEAHHVAAPTWSSVRESFAGKPIVQFTATPFREDGRSLAGRNIYTFPLKEAQADGYFSQIDYIPVIDLFDTDRALAERALRVLRADIESGFQHVLMARVSSQNRTEAVFKLYNDLAPELKPVLLHSGLSSALRKVAEDSIRSGEVRIIVCVNMLGEGYDLPALKVAAVHDPQKSLGVTLQFIGRFARTSSGSSLGNATVLVARTDLDADTRLRELYSEDADWNLVLRDLTEAAVAEQAAVTEFEAGFGSLPEEVTLRNLLPKMSATVFRAASDQWDPYALNGFFGESNLLTRPIGLNVEAGVAWCIVEHRESVRWGNLRTIEQVTYELFVVYFDRYRRLLYVNSSENGGVFQDLAEALIGESALRYTGTGVYRVLSGIDRLVPTNVGVLDIQSQFRRFSMHVGSDVREGFPAAEAQTKTQTHISAGGFVGGERVDMSASLKGRIWSHSVASNLKQWVDWCDSVGTKLIDRSIDLTDVIANFIYPQDLVERPEAVLLALEWPWEIYLRTTERMTLTVGDESYFILDVDLRVDDYSTTGPFLFSVVSPDWEVPYRATVSPSGIAFEAIGSDVELSNGSQTTGLAEWMNLAGLMFLLDGDATIEPSGKLLRPNRDSPPFDRGLLRGISWADTDINVESQRADKNPRSVQARMIRELSAEATWDIQIDDDGSGEMADIVSLRIDGDYLVVRLTHCKFSSSSPGARVGDLYEVCGQAMKSVVWRKKGLEILFRHLERRVRAKARKTNSDPFEVGDLAGLFKLREQSRILRTRFEIDIVQPGVDAARASDSQLELLAAVETYVRHTANAEFRVYTS